MRHGFGFYNPNHAAALICAAFPFLLFRLRRAWLCRAVAALLLVPLSLTLSRTGFAVLVAESAVLAVLKGGRAWKTAVAVVCLAAAAFGAAGGFGRFALDASAANRPLIWKAGLALCAENPGGVGFGNSGKLVSVFMLDGVECRTLVNSHLTLLAESGAATGFIWFLFVSGAISGCRKKPETACAFAGMTASAAASSVFDPGTLFDFRGFAGLGTVNFALSWASLSLYVAMGAVLWSGISRRRLAASVSAAALLAFALPWCFTAAGTPRVKDGCVVSGGPDAPLVLYDPSWRLRAVVPHLEADFVLPLEPGDHAGSFERIWYFGDAAEYSSAHSDARHSFFFPSEFFMPPPGTEAVVGR